MKYKTLMFSAGLCILAITNTAFVNQSNLPTGINAPIETKASFPKFLSHFEKVELPFKFELSDLPKYEAKKQQRKLTKKKTKSIEGIPPAELQRYIYDLRIAGMSRMGPPKVMPVARFYPNEKMIAVVYGLYNTFGGMKNMQFKMAVYDLKGNLIGDDETELFSGNVSFPLAQISFGKTETFELDAENHIWKKTYKNLFKKDAKKHGFNNNEIIGYELENTKVFKLNKKGLVEPVNEYPVSDKASLD